MSKMGLLWCLDQGRMVPAMRRGCRGAAAKALVTGMRLGCRKGKVGQGMAESMPTKCFSKGG